MQLVGGEKVEPDTHTLIRSNKKDLDRVGGLRESLVGMKEGIPGVYSGFKRTEKRYSKLGKKGKTPLISVFNVFCFIEHFHKFFLLM